MEGDQKLHHFDDVSKHSATKDCWLIIHGKVYDVTPFMDEHPGGDEVLLAATKKDATNDFEDIGHSNQARELMDKYCIGKIDASTIPVNRVFIPPEQTPYNPDKTSDFTIKILQFLVPVMILGVAFAVRYYTRAE
ncbi:cytochrome b5 isoform X2 [Dendrobium catenatum]|uniref:Cytochrome b5 isoform A n=2 Tax=Dendrobium catenatum TaxID=906689 RepID=A0A2I0VK48_9ASPA|nr:cytochrome b5 isoform X2 [Dendrobium catenatum]PKU63784.1 Cytochrome b5 isoform A [Dendrobium catenatum]